MRNTTTHVGGDGLKARFEQRLEMVGTVPQKRGSRETWGRSPRLHVTADTRDFRVRRDERLGGDQPC
jgi:hypothetical protein